MDDRLRRRVGEMSRALAVEEQQRLETAGTLVDLERLTMEIGDELTRQLMQHLLAGRAQQAVARQVHPCPTCTRQCPVESDGEPVLLRGMRGDIEYQEPRCFCSRCRRAFFPSGERTATSPA